jgi:hypothetical protein
MTDIVSVGSDLGLFDTDTARAANILSVQKGSLAYEPEMGIDLKYFLSPDFRFQNESFKSYLVQVLASYSINVSSVVETIEALAQNYAFNITPSQAEDGLIAK